MALYIGILIFSFILTSLLMVPFINLLFRLHLTHHKPIPPLSKAEAPEYSKLNRLQSWKLGTPIGGGILIIFLTSLLFIIFFNFFNRLGIGVFSAFSTKEELNIIFFSFVAFGLLGLYDDIVKIFNISSSTRFNLAWPNRKTFLIVCLSLFVAMMMHLNLDISIINIPGLGVINFGWWYVPMAGAIIALFCKAFDITDGLDGLAPGILLISLISFWAISIAAFDTVISLFIALLVGGLIAFLYFNVYPARIWLGNAGSLSFGATLAIIGLLLGKTFALMLVGGVILAEGLTQLIQTISLGLTGKKFFSVTPLHYWLQIRGWPEPKIVFRLWLISIFMAILGLWFATL